MDFGMLQGEIPRCSLRDTRRLAATRFESKHTQKVEILLKRSWLESALLKRLPEKSLLCGYLIYIGTCLKSAFGKFNPIEVNRPYWEMLLTFKSNSKLKISSWEKVSDAELSRGIV